MIRINEKKKLQTEGSVVEARIGLKHFYFYNDPCLKFTSKSLSTNNTTFDLLHRHGPVAGHRFRWTRPVPGGQRAGDGGREVSARRQCLCHFCGSGQPKLTGKDLYIFIYIFFLIDICVRMI